ncbi:peptidyl-prolyl cis-trans isomerase [Cohnella yongneupensis]|uniref:peptidylprolyl isomerase n=1 Tax=Cohnella yongneupensis TaxID=425006 RepID=A0ABW0QZ22_9BACL
MRETIRHWPLVLLALFTWVMSGCDSESRKALPVPSPSSAVPITTHLPSSQPSDLTQGEIVAKVGTASITREQLTDRLLAQNGKQTLRELMLAEAVAQEANELGLQVTPEELDQELLVMRQGYDSEEQFYEAMHDQLGMSRDDVQAEARYRLLTEKLSIRDIIVTDAELDQYIADHKELTTIRYYYDLAQIVVEDEATARELLTQLEGGAAFGALAERYSLDEFTADTGGELGWVEDRDPFTDPEVLKNASEMEVGDITGPIETGNGYVIVALNGRRQEQPRGMEEIRTSARREIALGKAKPMRELEQSLLEKYGAEVLDASLR